MLHVGIIERLIGRQVFQTCVQLLEAAVHQDVTSFNLKTCLQQETGETQGKWSDDAECRDNREEGQRKRNKRENNND